VWARDFAAAYDLLSAEDQAQQAEDSYVAQHDPFDGSALALLRHMAGHIEFSGVQVELAGDAATVTMHVRVPDGNDADVSQILYARPNDSPLSEAEVSEQRARLDTLWANGQIDVLEGDYEMALKRQAGRWGVAIGLANAVRVRLSGGVQAGLPWEFGPLVDEVLLFPGQMATVTYRARNLADHAVSGKATEVTLPAEQAGALFFAQCFCLLQETLQPGQEATMVAVLRLDRPLPAGAELSVHYDFYPAEAFPPSAD
jgi:hypothetical protein